MPLARRPSSATRRLDHGKDRFESAFDFDLFLLALSVVVRIHLLFGLVQGSGYLGEREDHSGALQEEVHEFWIQGTVAGDPLLKGG